MEWLRAALISALHGAPTVLRVHGLAPEHLIALLDDPLIAAHNPLLVDGECAAVPFALPLWRDVATHWPVPPIEEPPSTLGRAETPDERADALEAVGPESMFEVMHARLRRASRVRPIILLLHDLAHIDGHTARFLGHLHARMEAGEDHVAIIAMAADTPDSVDAAHAHAHAPAIADALQPLPLVAVAGERADVLQQLQDAAAAVADDEAAATRAMYIIAVLGSVKQDALADLLAMSADELEQIVQRLQAMGLLRRRANGALAVASAALRQVLYDCAMESLTSDDEAAAARGNSIAPTLPADRMREPLPAVLRWLVREAVLAQQRYTWLAAARLIDRALRHPAARLLSERERGWLLYRTALYWRYADEEYASSLLDQVMRIARVARDDVLLLGATYHHGLIECWLGRPSNGIREMEATVTAIEELSDAEYAHLNLLEHMGTRKSREHRGTLVTWLTMVGRFDDALHLGDRRLDVVAPPDLEEMPSSTSGGDGYSALGELYAFLGQPDLSRAYYEAARKVYTAFNHHHQVGWAAVDQLMYLMLPFATEDVEQRRALAQVADLEWDLSRDTVGSDVPGLALIHEHYLSGNWQRVRELCAEAREHARGETIVTPLEMLLSFHAGDGAALARQTERILPDGVDTHPGNAIYDLALYAQRLSALHAVAEGDTRAARSWLQALDRWLRWSRGVLGDADRHIAWAVYYLHLGQLVPAREHVFLAYGRASDPRQPQSLCAARRVQAQVALDQRAWGEARRCIDEALAIARRSEHVPDLLTCQAIEVRVLRAEDRFAEAADAEALVTAGATRLGSLRIIESMSGRAHF